MKATQELRSASRASASLEAPRNGRDVVFAVPGEDASRTRNHLAVRVVLVRVCAGAHDRMRPRRSRRRVTVRADGGVEDEIAHPVISEALRALVVARGRETVQRIVAVAPALFCARALERGDLALEITLVGQIEQPAADALVLEPAA